MAAAGLFLLILSGVAQAAVPPSMLTGKLFATPFRQNELPAGFSDARVTLEEPNKALGAVMVEVTGPDVGHLISYAVYPSAAAAAKRIAETGSDAKMRYVGRVPGWGKQSRMYVGSVTGKNVLGQTVTNGMTALGVVRGPVVVMAVSLSASSKSSGDVQSARRLLAAAVKHLDRVRG